jgi:bifunctional DNA-binding transcriptional regulator/antitoxin component of YhaV-PrlF toxin-antitoxin module
MDMRKMVKFTVKSNPQGQYYFPKEVRAELGTELDLICNARAAVVFSKDTPFEVILKSIELIAQDLRQRIEYQKETECQTA